MAMFGSNNDKEEKAEEAEGNDTADNTAKSLRGSESRLFSVLKNPRITEKATRLAEEKNVYTFVIDKDATKKEVEKAVSEFYDVTPVDVRTAKIPQKKIRQRRGKGGTKGGGKKAYVTLAEGDSIELF